MLLIVHATLAALGAKRRFRHRGYANLFGLPQYAVSAPILVILIAKGLLSGTTSIWATIIAKDIKIKTTVD